VCDTFMSETVELYPFNCLPKTVAKSETAISLCFAMLCFALGESCESGGPVNG
jgi:hypothetical protein